MEWLNIETLKPNPDNEHKLSDPGKELLLHAMSLGDHGVFLLAPEEKMIINGNNRWHLRIEAGWDNRYVLCRYLTAGQDAEGFYAIIDGKVVLDHEVIPYHYISLEALYAAYAFSANGEAGYYEKSVIDKFPSWGLDPAKFVGDFFPPKSFADSMKALKTFEKKKKYEIVVTCDNEEDMDAKYQEVVQLGYRAKRRI